MRKSTDAIDPPIGHDGKKHTTTSFTIDMWLSPSSDLHKPPTVNVHHHHTRNDTEDGPHGPSSQSVTVDARLDTSRPQYIDRKLSTTDLGSLCQVRMLSQKRRLSSTDLCLEERCTKATRTPHPKWMRRRMIEKGEHSLQGPSSTMTPLEQHVSPIGKSCIMASFKDNVRSLKGSVDSSTAPYDIKSLSPRIIAKVKEMRSYILTINPRAGRDYTTIDADGLGNPSKVRMFAIDFAMALKILAVDLELGDPLAIDLNHAQEMISLEKATLHMAPYTLQWVVVDFTTINDLERKARALIGHLGLRRRSLIGIECCMQAWQRDLRVSAGTPTLLFRPYLCDGQSITAHLCSWTGAQQQSQKEVEELIHEEDCAPTRQVSRSRLGSKKQLHSICSSDVRAIETLIERRTSSKTVQLLHAESSLCCKSACQLPLAEAI